MARSVGPVHIRDGKGDWKYLGEGSMDVDSIKDVTPRRLNPGDVIRIPHYATRKGCFRVWQVTGVHLGALGQESTYALKTLDMEDHKPIHVPCAMLDLLDGIEVFT
jgi:hypothetical protein